MISVVIPVYNRSDELHRALHSLVEQTVKNFEVLVCDDGSEDDIESVVATFAHLLNIRYFRLEHSGGPANSRRLGVSQASYEWVSFLDSDDWWFPNKVEVVTAQLSDKIDLLYHPLKIVYRSSWSSTFKFKSVGRPIEGNPLVDMLSRGNPIPNSAVTVRKSFLNANGTNCNDKALASFEDFDTWITVAKHGGRFQYINCHLGYYWIGSDNISTISVRQIERQKLLFSRHLNDLPSEITDWARSYNEYIVGTYLFNLKQPKGALEAFKKADNLRFRSQRIKRLIKMSMAIISLIYYDKCRG